MNCRQNENNSGLNTPQHKHINLVLLFGRRYVMKEFKGFVKLSRRSFCPFSDIEHVTCNFAFHHVYSVTVYFWVCPLSRFTVFGWFKATVVKIKRRQHYFLRYAQGHITRNRFKNCQAASAFMTSIEEGVSFLLLLFYFLV